MFDSAVQFVVVVAILLAAIFYSSRLLASFVAKTIIYEYETGLKYVNGKLVDTLSAGAYRYNARSTSIKTVDTRPHFITVPSQEVLSKDGVTVKLSVAVTMSVNQPEVAVHHVSNYHEAFYLLIQQALRSVVGQLGIDELLEQRTTLGNEIEALVAEDMTALGLQASSVGIKDITFPGTLKQTFAQVVKAKQDGLAALERARGESAALRNLANTAKLLENNPALMQLRTLQALDESSGNTVVLNLTPDKQAGVEQPA